LGKAVAWTSDATGRWARNWVTWDQYVRFWAQLVRYTFSEGAQSNVAAEVTQVGEHARIRVDARSEEGAYLNGLTLQVNVVDPAGQTQTVTLQQIAPGRYEGTFTPTTEGAYLLRVAGADPAAPAEAPVAETAGWVLSYSPEYQTLAADPNFLLRVAQATGGHVVGEDTGEIFRHDLPIPARASRPVWPALLVFAALLLPLDIAVRRLVVTRYDLQRGWQRVSAWLTTRRTLPAQLPAHRAEQLTSLFKAKDRAGMATARDVKPHDGPSMPPIVTSGPRPGNVESPSPTVAAPPRPASSSGAPTPTTAAALLAKKKAREKK
jgi:hypothetical protein